MAIVSQECATRQDPRTNEERQRDDARAEVARQFVRFPEDVDFLIEEHLADFQGGEGETPSALAKFLLVMRHHDGDEHLVPVADAEAALIEAADWTESGLSPRALINLDSGEARELEAKISVQIGAAIER